MAGVLNYALIQTFPPNFHRTNRKFKFAVRASTGKSESNLNSASNGNSSTGIPAEITFFPSLNFEPPKPIRFKSRPDRRRDILGACTALLFRFGTGVFVSGYSAEFVPNDGIPSDQYAFEIAGKKLKESSKLGPRPEKPLEIYEYESCPFCRKVREIVSILNLDVMFYPCPKNGPNFRPKAVEMGGKKQFPYMVDPNTGVEMYESDDIIKYLVNKYGDGKVPRSLSLGPLTISFLFSGNLSAGLALTGRFGRGNTYMPAKLAPRPLVLWAYEGSPFCKVVREVLVELELPHIQRSCARGSPKRQELFARHGHFQVPFLEDPNTGVEMFESAEIVDYLKATYAL